MKALRTLLVLLVVLLVINLVLVLSPTALAQARGGNRGKCVGVATYHLPGGGAAVFVRVWEDGTVERAQYEEPRYGPFVPIN